MTSMNRAWILAAGIASGLGAQAASLQGRFTADDFATVYLSTDLVADASDLVLDKITTWQTGTGFADAALTPGQDHYLLISVRNSFGGMAALIGDFSISGTGFAFAGGGTTLSTDAPGWAVNTGGFGIPGAAPYVIGPNGSSPWGTMPGISPGAQFIWADNAFAPGGEAFFMARIAAAVPEPGTWALWTAGLALMGGLAARRR